jgi:hypothetical protein
MKPAAPLAASPVQPEFWSGPSTPLVSEVDKSQERTSCSKSVARESKGLRLALWRSWKVTMELCLLRGG